MSIDVRYHPVSWAWVRYNAGLYLLLETRFRHGDQSAYSMVACWIHGQDTTNGARRIMMPNWFLAFLEILLTSSRSFLRSNALQGIFITPPSHHHRTQKPHYRMQSDRFASPRLAPACLAAALVSLVQQLITCLLSGRSIYHMGFRCGEAQFREYSLALACISWRKSQWGM